MSRRLALLAIVASASLLVTSASAAPSVTGTLSKSGYTVVAISTSNGKTTTAVHRGRTFTVKSPGSRMTLQLVSPKGSYAGSIVVGKKGAKAIVGIKAGAKLGKVRIRRGYATPVKRLAAKYVDARRTATAKAGVPVGARGYGLIARKGATSLERAGEAQATPPPPTGGGQPGGTTAPDTSQAGADPDRDGVPSGLDIDANGNGVIDAVDPNAPRAAGFQTFVNYFVDLDQTVNVNAEAASGTRIDDVMRQRMELVFLNVPTGAELDCNGLTWCSPGGTGQIQPATAGPQAQPGTATTPFPACCDSDGNGFGSISGTSQSAGGGSEFRIWPRATSTQVRSGDTMIMRVPEGGGVREIPGALGFVFTTVPAVQSWSTATRSATISYPVPAGGTGTQGNPFTIDPTAMGLTLRFWRPQRVSIPTAGEPAGFMDIGHLRYLIQLPDPPSAPPLGAGNSVQCPASTMSTSDPNLTIGGGTTGEARDSAADAPSSAANLLSFTIDLGACITGKGGSLASGGQFRIHLEGMTPSGGDHANQNIFFRIA